MEEAVGQHIWPLESLGAPHSVLRALRPLLFLETAQIAASPLLGQLPASCVVHHLYSRAPAELQSPHQRSGLTPAQARLLSAARCQTCHMDPLLGQLPAAGLRGAAPVFALPG